LREQAQGTTQDWQPVIQGIEELVSAGVPPSNRELRDLLLPIVDELPDDEELPKGLRMVARELDRYLARRQFANTPAESPAPTDGVQQAAHLLAGRSAVLIGGVRRPEAQKLLTAALGLKELVWVETKEHQSIDRFESAIARTDVALVLLAIRWSSHGFGDVKQFCDRYGKPLVRLPGGYSPNQVAAQVVDQAGRQLGEISPTF